MSLLIEIWSFSSGLSCILCRALDQIIHLDPKNPHKASRWHSSVHRSKFNQWHQVTAANTLQLLHSSSWNRSFLFFLLFFKIRHTWRLLSIPSSAVVFVNIYVHHWLPWLVLIRCCRGDSVSGIQALAREGGVAVVTGDGHCWGSSDGCFLGFRVSMRDWTPRFTLVVTRRVTESAAGEDEEPARWEGGRATRHFWYRSWERRGLDEFHLDFGL